MFFVLSKVLWFLVRPSTVLILGSLIAAWFFGRRPRIGRGAIFAALFGGLLVFGFTSLPHYLVAVIETRFQSPDLTGVEPDGIIVLGGPVMPDQSAAHGVLQVNDTAERLMQAIVLARRYPRAKLVFTGGSGALIFRENTESEPVERFLLDAGIPAERMAFERTSRNTWENAVNSKALVEPEPGETWLLVTSAFHMPRSVGIFRKVGWAVIPYPVDFRTTLPYEAPVPVNSGLLSGLHITDLAVHEVIGLVAYYLTGKTSSLFPGPDTSAPGGA